MNDKRIPLEKEEPKHKKKSKAKGLSRSKHKHTYETVLLIKNYRHTDLKTGAPKVTQMTYPTKVCTICGRIGETDHDESYYIKGNKVTRWLWCHHDDLSEKALNLPKWYTHDYFDKFAYEGE